MGAETSYTCKGVCKWQIWAIARVGDTSVVRKVEKQRLDSLLLDEARAKKARAKIFRNCRVSGSE